MKTLLVSLFMLATAPLAAAASNAPEKIPNREVVQIAYETWGAGDTALVFIHDWSCDRSYWLKQLEVLALDYRLVAVDLGGHGASSSARKTWTIATYGNDVASVVTKLDLKRVILIGQGMGADAAVEAARRVRERVIGIVWVDAHKSLGTAPKPDEIDTLLSIYQKDFADAARTRVRGMFRPDADPALVDRVAADVSDAPQGIALTSLKSAYNFERDLPEVLKTLELPVVAINADDMPTDAASLGAHGVKTVIMARSGHFLMMEDPARFNKLLKVELDQLVLGTSGPQQAQAR